MLAGGSFYPYSCNPEDVWESVQKEQENLLFIDVQVRGRYPGYARKLFAEKQVQLYTEPGDDALLRENTVDFISFSYYASRCVGGQPGGQGRERRQRGALGEEPLSADQPVGAGPSTRWACASP